MTYTVGLDVGGTKMLGGVMGPDGEIVQQARRPTPAHDSRALLDEIADLVGEFGDSYEVEAVGLSFAGLVDASRSTVLLAVNLGWVNEPLRALVEGMTGYPTIVENDANAAAWGEYVFGAGRGRDELVMVTVGTGIGGGVILGGQLRRGANGVGAEFGHLRLVRDGRQCACRRHGCWEQYASGNALVRTARELAANRREDAEVLMGLGDGTPEGIQGLHVTEAAGRGDLVALKAFEMTGYWLARGMVEVATLLDPACFVIGGGVVESGDLLLSPCRKSYAEQLVARAQRPLPEIIPAALGNEAGMVGAAHLARDHGPVPVERRTKSTTTARSPESGRSGSSGARSSESE